MKRFALIVLSILVIILGSDSCQKINDLDQRLSDVESSLSKLEAQITAGAVITTVDKTNDGCTFTLSNGHSYKVTNGKDGSDGEAIIADVKIEEDFVVLTLKNNETLRISYQNPLSMVTLNIVPDYDDGTVSEPVFMEVMEIMSTVFYLDVAVTPAKYARILSDTERFIHKAVFSPVKAKGDFGNAFSVSPKSVTYMEGASIPYLQVCFEIDDQTAEMIGNSAYTVSYSIEDKDGVHGASTGFVAISKNNDKKIVYIDESLESELGNTLTALSNICEVHFVDADDPAIIKEISMNPFSALIRRNGQTLPEGLMHLCESVLPEDVFVSCAVLNAGLFSSDGIAVGLKPYDNSIETINRVKDLCSQTAVNRLDKTLKNLCMNAVEQLQKHSIVYLCNYGSVPPIFEKNSEQTFIFPASTELFVVLYIPSSCPCSFASNLEIAFLSSEDFMDGNFSIPVSFDSDEPVQNFNNKEEMVTMIPDKNGYIALFQ